MKIDVREIAERIIATEQKYGQKIIALDGPGGSGKSTLAKKLETLIPEAVIIHVDDFYKPTKDRVLSKTHDVNPDFNWDRFEHEVLIPLSKSQPVRYQIYDWHKDALADFVHVPHNATVIIEGGFSTQERFKNYYDFTIWIQAPTDIRLERALKRDGEHMRHYWENHWIPVDQNYIKIHNPASKADIALDGHSSDIEKGIYEIIEKK